MPNPEPSPERYARMREIFEAVVDLPPAQARRRVAELTDDESVRREVEMLLTQSANAAFEDRHLGAMGENLLRADHPVEIGPFRIDGILGEGGMGSVYRAEQRAPIERTVALKVIQHRTARREESLRRFELERRSLARMDHRYIARIYEGGATEDGWPYFAMELVEGEPIVPFCDRRHLSIMERLRLFARVCQAVQHAHQKGVIHRDLKNSNVLVATQDGESFPKLIDFGIALPNESFAERTRLTAAGQLIGTPHYMPPEQLEGRDIDTRADVYALGVLLYKLLTGSLPFDDTASTNLPDLIEEIRNSDPSRPSTRITPGDRHAEQAAAQRSVGADNLRRTLRGELDWIIARTLEKDRERRYASAAELEQDIERFVAREPVLAAPPSVGYRLRNAMRRNRGLFAAGAMLFVVLLGGIGGTSWGLRSALLANTELDTQLRRANEAKRTVTEILQSADPWVAVGVDSTLLEQILERAGDRLLDGAVEDRQTRNELHLLVGDSLGDLGRLEEALRHFECALAAGSLPDAAHRLAAFASAAHVTGRLGRLDESERLVAAGLEVVDHRSATNPRWELRLLRTRAANLRRRDDIEGAAVAYGQLLERSRTARPDDHAFELEIEQSMADLELVRGNQLAAEARLRATVSRAESAFGVEHPTTLRLREALQGTVSAIGKHDESLELANANYAGYRNVLGESHDSTQIAKSHLASALLGIGRHIEAAEIYEDVIEKLDHYGESHPQILRLVSKLAEAYGRSDRRKELETRRDLVRRYEAAGMGEALDAVAARANLARVMTDFEPEAAVEYGREAVRIARAAHGDRHIVSLSTETVLGFAMMRAGSLEAADGLLRGTARHQLQQFGPKHGPLAMTMAILRDVAAATGRDDPAVGLYAAALEADAERADADDATLDTLRRAADTFLDHPVPSMRDARRACGFARRAVRATSRQDPLVLELLARALYASDDAIAARATLHEAMQLVEPRSSVGARLASRMEAWATSDGRANPSKH